MMRWMGLKASFQGGHRGRSQAAEIADGHGTDFDERLAADADGPGLGVEPLALARGAADHAHVLFQLQPARPGGGLLEAAQQLRNDAFPLAAVLPDAAAALLPFEGDVLVAGAVQQPVAGALAASLFQGVFRSMPSVLATPS